VNLQPLIRDWHAHELQADYGLDGVRLVMGCPVWGDLYVDQFLGYCLPSLVANKIDGCALVLFVDGPTEQRLLGYPCPIPTIFRRLPEPIMEGLYAEPGHKYFLLAAAHNLLIHQAAKVGAGFHMTVPDTVYSVNYFENLERLGKQHAAIAHTGFAIVPRTGLPVLDGFRQASTLKISAADLGRIGWEHLNPQWASWTMDDITDFQSSGENGQLPLMPSSHYIHWRGRDAYRIHCAHQSAAWISPERCKQVTPELGGTVDSELPRYLAGDFYAPTLADDMTYIVIACESPVDGRVPFEVFQKEFWRFIGSDRRFMPYFLAPCVVPAPHDESAPDDAELDRRLAALIARLEA